jgi:hypothetical protein
MLKRPSRLAVEVEMARKSDLRVEVVVPSVTKITFPPFN